MTSPCARPQRRLSRARARVAVGIALVLAGCIASRNATFDVRALGERNPALAAHPHQRLADAAPYFAVAPSGLVLFLCRWRTTRPIPVLLPEDATAEEEATLRAALDAWVGAGLGVTFEVAPRTAQVPEHRIEIDFVEDPHGALRVPGGDTIADCAVPSAVESSSAPIDAELTYASIHLRRSRRDAVGRRVALLPQELLGASVHELGHALGFPGHVLQTDGVMAARAQIDAARHWGRWLEEGRSLVSPTLAALYALPSGVRVGAVPLSERPLEMLRALEAGALAEGLRGPYVRVGDRSARMLWRTDSFQSVVLAIDDWRKALRAPAGLTLRANAPARRIVCGELSPGAGSICAPDLDSTR
jgi:hypothetical protein